MTGLEILDKVAYGQTLFHRDDDAWDLLDEDGLVAAVLCPRRAHLTVSLPSRRVEPKPPGSKIPYGELKADEIRAGDIERGRQRIVELAARERTGRD